ncbi:MAG: NAD(P)/FAD-dependent oxidoreductase [Candidatus Schekmanbacteria bacterium]|nr:NAD(P)/FAD-dependent oxidoreductase [Candidatus Schekmanbacteria bacterium]
METHDFVIIGAGHNGLTLGCYLATAGEDVVVLDRRAEFGGGLCTEEATIPGFYHNLHSNFHGAMPFFPPYKDFDLESRGLAYYHPDANIGMPLRDGRALILYADELRSHEEIARFSKTDAETWLQVRGMITTHLEEIVAGGFSPPFKEPDAEAYVRGHFDEWFGEGVNRMSALAYITSRFENPHVQALLLFHMAVGGWDIREPGLAPLGIAFLGYITNWQLCRGGSHQLAHVLGGVLLSSGGDLREHSHVSRILVKGGRAVGVRLKDGTEIGARKAVVSTVDPHQTFLEMLGPGEAPAELVAEVRQVRYGHGDVLLGVHLALNEAPRYAAARFNPDLDQTLNVNIGYETPADLIEHYEEIDRGEVPARPRLEVGCNTLFDPSQAPPGKHTGLAWQFVPYQPGGRSPAVWDDIKKEYGERCVEAWREYAPNMTPKNILGMYVYSPHDIARKMLNMRNGGFHCTAVLERQAGYNRPVASAGTLRTPIGGLYLGGASVHPHGGILAAPGYNCFQVLAEDFSFRGRVLIGNKFWEPAAKEWRRRLRAKGFAV